MDWATRLREPFFLTPEAADTYVTNELRRAVPQGWTIRRSPNEHLTWILGKQTPAPGEWPIQDFAVRISKGLDLVTFIYGNNDAGILTVRQAVQKALVLDAVMLRTYSLSECLNFVFANCPPNEWGYT
jgi:hypothetical protein